MGTAFYMSPEQVRGEKLDARTDIFSFGLVLYQMVTGQRAFPGNTTAVVHDGILHQEPTPPRRVNPELPLELERIITHAIEKDRDLRYQRAAEIRADLQNLKTEVTGAAIAGSTPTPAKDSRLPWHVGDLVPAFVALIGCGYFRRFPISFRTGEQTYQQRHCRARRLHE